MLVSVITNCANDGRIHYRSNQHIAGKGMNRASVLTKAEQTAQNARAQDMFSRGAIKRRSFILCSAFFLFANGRGAVFLGGITFD